MSAAIRRVTIRYQAVRTELATAEGAGVSWDRRVLLSALVLERLSHRKRASLLYLLLTVAGRGTTRSKAIKSIGNIILMRTGRGRKQLVAAYQLLGRDPVRRHLAAVQSGSVNHDSTLASEVASGVRTDIEVDEALNLATTGRWTSSLRIAETIARSQLDRILAGDLATVERDWSIEQPEPHSRLRRA